MKPADTYTSEHRVYGEADIRRMEAEAAAKAADEKPARTASARAKGGAKGATPSPDAPPAKKPTWSKAATAEPTDDTKEKS